MNAHRTRLKPVDASKLTEIAKVCAEAPGVGDPRYSPLLWKFSVSSQTLVALPLAAKFRVAGQLHRAGSESSSQSDWGQESRGH